MLLLLFQNLQLQLQVRPIINKVAMLKHGWPKILTVMQSYACMHFFSLNVYMQASQLAGLRVAYIAMRPCASLFSFRVWSWAAWVALLFHPTCKKVWLCKISQLQLYVLSGAQIFTDLGFSAFKFNVHDHVTPHINRFCLLLGS